MKRLARWKVSDAFWARVAPLIPERERDPSKAYQRKAGGGRKPLCSRQVFEGIYRFYGRAVSGSGSMTKAPLAQESVGRNPTDRGKKRSVLTDGHGIPLSIVVSGANTHDVKRLVETLDGIVVERPLPTDTELQHLCADAAYGGQPRTRTSGREVT